MCLILYVCMSACVRDKMFMFVLTGRNWQGYTSHELKTALSVNVRVRMTTNWLGEGVVIYGDWMYDWLWKEGKMSGWKDLCR